MSEWKKYKLSEIYTMSSGISSSKSQAGQGSPFLSFSTVFNNYFIPENLKDLMLTTKEEQERFSIIEGDVFLTRTSETLDELALSSVALNNYPFATFSGFLKRLRSKNKIKVYPKFIAFYLRSSYFRKTIINHTTMTLRASFNESMFSYLEVYLPDYDEQVRIGDFLYKLNQKITLNNQINEELEAMAKTLYDYWFVQFDFPDENGKPYKSSGGKMVYNDQLKREIPEGWGVEAISNILDKVPNSNKIVREEYLDFGTIPVIDQSREFICGYTENQNSILTPNDGHIVFGDHTRIVKYINFEYARGADGTQIIISKNENVPTVLLYQFISSIDLSNYGYARHYKFLKEKLILVPNINISRKYSENAETIFNRIRQTIFENQELTQLRDWLLPMLMNGQVKVEE
ncbi:restriction endonuclease subunit S [Streptococcus suis]|uniref:Putative type-1 restriction enzyme MjaXP specificity protein n=1 Tax=Streptococcus suis TaxID=1307 RepID=A0A116KUT2_STRSU|nr:restriction endonuclease subunit S [Streptococcus suis]NQH91617.1 restriction endonuclease subunit S [Streptococcus suis]NQI11966.1 restriction endonuclease subunit S [Streptococcus suis]NQN90344.1 restriction endonuclease subunit S [Streptococcus suis]NQO08818.1 restriction endonuclease subunit S [Streptococcus suis]NQO10938.1 restriction endonuclease subunit S [Streptococcus suis]